MCLAQDHNPVTPVRLEPAASLSRVKHSNTGPLCSLMTCDEMRKHHFNGKITPQDENTLKRKNVKWTSELSS